MRDSKLCLLLLLSTSALTFAQDEDQPTCLLAKRYKALHKYVYKYDAETFNAINGASALKNGPGVYCMVEIEVPQTCSFIVRTKGCTLNEVVGVDAEGNRVLSPSPNSDSFAAEMARYPLRVVVEGVYDVKLYPEEGETTTVLNVKRGIISALAVPLVEEDMNKNMPTIHGNCRTEYTTVNGTKGIASEYTLNRDLSRCDKFVPMRGHMSPLALISGMHYPLAQLVRSFQTCNYKFDDEKRHMTSGSCTENHILIPFSHQGQYGVTNVGKQKLTLIEVSPHNDRVFHRGDVFQGLHMGALEDNSLVQDKAPALDLLRELANLPEAEGERRAGLFNRLVTEFRGMTAETVNAALPEAEAVSRVLAYQVLAQCGTPECSSGIMQILRTLDSSLPQVDAAVFAMGLVANPSALLIHDMLQMAKYKPSKPIMYALSNVVKRFYKGDEQLIPEIVSVAHFMAAQLGDCSGDKEDTFLALRVIGNMAPAMIPASPPLRAAVIKCMDAPAASPAVQQAAIQVYRLIHVTEEARGVLMRVLLDSARPMQSRIAAYLVLMKRPETSELVQLANALPNEPDQQVKSFITSHITNILSSTDPETQELRQEIRNALQDNEIGPIMDPTQFSRNYKVGSVQSNMIFEGNSYLPKEVMLEMTLKAFGYEIDMMEIGMDGSGFEPSVEALFGPRGFFPDTIMKTMLIALEIPERVKEIVRNIVPALKKDRMKRQASNNLIKEIGHNLHTLMEKMKAAESPEATVYLRLLGNELGYLKTKDIDHMAYSAGLMINSMMQMFPGDLMKALMTKTDNTIYGHYIFMDNEVFLPTITGVPLRVALSGTFTPGVKGGLKIASDMSEVSFMPSAGIEFVTKFGTFVPEFSNSGIEMHTNIFHESGLSAKISMARDLVKLTVPAPTIPTKLIKITNTLVAVTRSEVRTMPPMVMDKVDVSECTPFFAGMKYCTALQYIDAYSQETAPYFPFNGDSKFAVELHPTGEVTEYTATVAYELLREGEEGRQKVDSVKFTVRAEGAEPTEARAIVKYNRRKNVITADLQIPDYDVEAGLRLGVVDGNTKGKGTHSISLDLINKNIPQLSLVGRANLKAMKEGMLQVQLLVPSINAEATVTADLKRDEELELKLKSEVKIMDATSEQNIAMKYDASKIEFEFKSDVNTETSILPNADVFEMYGNQLLDTQVGQSDMKARHILKKFVEAANNHMDKYGADIPYIQNFRVPDMPVLSLPDTLFLNAEAKAIYHFNSERWTIAIPLPLGGKSAVDLNFPPALTTPSLSLPNFGLEIVSAEIPIPSFVVPESVTLSLPLFGKAEVSTLMRSNLYDAEASMSAGKDVVETPSYSAKFAVKGSSPFDILSIKMEGSGMLATTDSLKAELKSSLTHKFIEASVSVTEEATVTDKINMKSSSKIEAKSPFGLNFALEHTGTTGVNTEEISADSSFEGTFKAGPLYGKTTSTQALAIYPFRPQAKMDSTVQIDSTILQAQNTIAASLVNGELSVVSNTNAYDNLLTQVAELSFKDQKLSMKCDANALALGIMIRNQAEASVAAGEFLVRIEANADHSENRAYSLLTASLNADGLAVNSDASLKLLENEATHKALLKMNKDGLTTSGTTTLQSPLSLENTFQASLDASRATVSVTNKAAVHDIKVDTGHTLTVTLSSLEFNSKSQASASEYASHTHDISVNLKPYTASANVNNNLQLLAANFVSEAQLQAELYKMDLTGSMKATYGEEELKHTYQVNYEDMIANAKCSTTGKLFGTHMNHNTELEVVGLAAKFTNDARFNSQPMRFDHSIRCSIVPFDFNLDAIFNADGDMSLYGKQSAQLYGKFLLKAQPLAFATSHECRASVSHRLDNGFFLETTSDNKMDTLLTLQEQRASFSMKSKMNEQNFHHGMSIYNNAERAGIEVSSAILTNIIDTDAENQEFAVSGFLKYDKNTDSHIIQIPFTVNLPVVFESIKAVVVRTAELMQDGIYVYMMEFQGILESLPLITIESVDLEGKLTKLKQYFSDLTQEYVISLKDVEDSFSSLKSTVKLNLDSLKTYVRYVLSLINEIIFPETQIDYIQQQLIAIFEENDIKSVVLYFIDTITALVQKIDLANLKGSGAALLRDIDAKYDIVATLRTTLSDMKEKIETFDATRFAADLRRFISSIHYKAHIEDLIIHMPKYIFTTIVDCVREVIREFDIVGKMNKVYGTMREMTLKFQVDKKVQEILEKTLELLKQLRMEETIRAAGKMVTDADIPAKFLQRYKGAVEYLNSTEVKDILQNLNMYIQDNVQKLNSWSYNEVVDFANEILATCTSYLNELIRTLEIPQKLETTRDFVNLVFSSARGFLDGLREIKIAEIIKSVKEAIDEVVLDNLKSLAAYVKEKITRLDIHLEIFSGLEFFRSVYQDVVTCIHDMFSDVIEKIKEVASEQKIVSEIQQIFDGLITELKTVKLVTPSFTIPLTDLTVPSVTFTASKIRGSDIPTQLDIPEFNILGSYNVKATTITLEDIKQIIVDLIDMIINFDIPMPDVDTLFGDLTMSYLPSMSELRLPEITLPEMSFLPIPQIPVEKLVKSLQVPEIKLPTIPGDIMVPCFGKLYSEIKFISPVYTIKTSAEFQNSTENQRSPQFSGLLSSQGTSPIFDILNYKLVSTAQIAFPKMRRFVIAESVKLQHLALGVEHQASLTLYGFSGQAHAKTAVKVSTSPYAAEFLNAAFIAMERGVSASLDTTYNHQLNLPMFDIRGEANATQKAIVQQDGLTITLTADNSGTGKMNGDDGQHVSKMQMSLTPRLVTLRFSGDTDCPILKMKQQISAEFGTLSHIKFNVRNVAEAPLIKNSLFVASGHVNRYDMNAELKANHNTELHGAVSGVLSNAINVVARPSEFIFDFQNKGNAKVNVFESLMAKVDLQNDYSAIIKPEIQQVSTLALARLNQYKMFYNFTVDNNENEAGVFGALDGEANLDFLKYPISIPELEFDLPGLVFRTPAISNLNLYEQMDLNNILTSTEQTVDVDAKIVYKKSQSVPLVDLMGVIQIPSVGDLISELSFKSAIINLNVNAGLYTHDDLVLRLGATTVSVFEGLKAKLDGTTSLTTKRGVKLANSLSLENRYVEGTHDSSVTMNTETFEPAVSMATIAKIALPIFTLEANQNLLADTKTKANAASTLRMKADFDIPVIKAVGKAEADHSLKLEGTFEYISVESSHRANMDANVLKEFLVLGILDNMFNLYLNKDGLRSTSKVITDAKLNHGPNKIIAVDVNENLAVEASLSRVYAVLKYTGNNVLDLFFFDTQGKHVAQGTVDFAPMSSLTADLEINIVQPSSLGPLTFVEKTVADVTVAKQKLSTNAELVIPLVSSKLVAEIEGNAPVFNVMLKSSTNSALAFLDYDLDASSTANFENEALNMVNKAVLKHSDLKMDVNHVITQALRRKRQADDSISRHTLNVDITCPAFTDMNLRYAAGRDAISASLSTPSNGFLGLQFNSRVPSQMRVYGRYPTSPEVDVDILVIKSALKDADKMNLQIAFNMEALKLLLSELKMRLVTLRLPNIISTFKMLADKYNITTYMEQLRTTVSDRIDEAYNAAIHYDEHMSQLSIFFRNIIVESQKTVQVFLEGVIKVLNETQFKLPGSDEMTTLPEVLKKLIKSIATKLDGTIHFLYENAELYSNAFIERFSKISVQMPDGDAISGGQIVDQVKQVFRKISSEVVDFVKNMESLDIVLVKTGETLKAIVEKTQEFVDSIKSDYLDAVFTQVNGAYRYLLTVTRDVIDYMYASVFANIMESVNHAFEYIMDTLIHVVDQFNSTVYAILQETSEEAQAYIKVSEGKLELDLPIPFQQ